ncbi:hypothetical protein FBULB1_7834 [Fusarium bulbicola]|nr:hypothetical protein FBULB1_7834 [Fusarium bulbicola]
MAPPRQEKKEHDRSGYEWRVGQKAKAAQSGSGRGTIGPDKNRGSSKSAQTMAQRHGITKGQKSLNIPIEEDDGRLVLVEAAKGPVHESAEELVDSSGDRQKNFMIYQRQGNDERLAGHLNKAEHASQAAQTAQALFGTPELLFDFRPYRPDRMAQAEAKRLRYDLARSTSAVTPITVTPSQPLNERITAPVEGRTPRPQSETASQAGTSHSKLCANCGGNGHLLANCVTAEHGSIKVCVFCKSKGHLTDECRSFKKLDLAAKVRLLVTDRAGKPPLSTRRGWWRYLHDFLVSEDTKDLPVPTKFPWRIELGDRLFDGMWSRTVDEVQAEFDRTRDKAKLPKDEAVQGMGDIYLHYWQGAELPWPRRLGEMPKDVEMRDQEIPAAYYEDLSGCNTRPQKGPCDMSDDEDED